MKKDKKHRGKMELNRIIKVRKVGLKQAKLKLGIIS